MHTRTEFVKFKFKSIIVVSLVVALHINSQWNSFHHIMITSHGENKGRPLYI